MRSVIFLHLWNKAGLQNAVQGFSLPPLHAPGSIIRFGREKPHHKLTCWLQEPSQLRCVSSACYIHAATMFLFPWGGRAAVTWPSQITSCILSIYFWLLLQPRGGCAAGAEPCVMWGRWRSPFRTESPLIAIQTVTAGRFCQLDHPCEILLSGSTDEVRDTENTTLRNTRLCYSVKINSCLLNSMNNRVWDVNI